MPIRLLLSLSFFLIPIICQAQLPNPDYYSLFQLTGGSGETRLIDSQGLVLHTWASNLSAPSGSAAYLREDGLLLKNGNILVTVWEFLPAAEMEALGWEPVNGVSGVWMEKIQELEPNLLDGSTNVVWEWALENHLVQDLDSNGANFADVGEERGRVDINFNAGITSGDYFHISGIDYSQERDEIVLCPNNIDELWVIDHSTTTAEAATSAGGTRGQGGELIYRWGNPAAYDFHNGPPEPRFLRRAHDPRWSVNRVTNQIQLTVHNNDRVDSTPGDSESQVLVLDLPRDGNGNYIISDAETFLPEAPLVLYEQDPSNPFFSTPFMGSAQRLNNGNVVITLSLSRTLVEVNPAGEIIWEETISSGGTFIFKSQSYSVNYCGFLSLPFNPILKGDVNLDGEVNFLDIMPFISFLTADGFGFQAEADINCDDMVNFFDIQPFIDILAGRS